MNQDFNTAFANFMQKAQIAVNADYRLTGGSTPPQLSAMHGARYIRIVADNASQRSSFAFVDTTNGDVLKAAGWKAPAKGARGNIYDAQNGCGRVSWTSVR